METKPPPPRERNPKRKAKTGRKLLFLYILLGVIAVLLVVVVVLLPREGRPPVRLPEMRYDELPQNEPSVDSSSTRVAPPSQLRSVQPGRSGSVASRPPAENPNASEPAAYRRSRPHGTLIFIVDDAGNNLSELRPFLEFPGPLTLSIMPRRPFTLPSYHMILEAGKVPILHQPMEADGKANPGAGAIYTAMSKQQVDETLTKNLKGMPEINWVNNHMGSKATSNVDTMTYVLDCLKQRNIHFLDSRTTTTTAVKQAALRLGLHYYERNSSFLDDNVDKKDILREIDAGLQVAQRDGYAVMIGHVWDRELPHLLIDLYPQLVAQGYEFADIRYLLEKAHPDVGTRN